MTDEKQIEVNPVVYPNPVTDKINIEMSDLTETSRISVMDLSGRFYQVTKLSQYNNHLELDLKSLPPGIYILRVYDDTYSRQFRIIKN